MTMGALTRDTMPTHEGDLSIEGHGFEPIPESSRYGSVARVFTVWFTPNLVPAAFFIGTLVTANFLGLGFLTSLLAIVVGNLVGSIVVGALAIMGPRTGMAQMPLARLAYGKSIVVPGLLNWLSCIGWDGINSIFGATALSILTPLPFVMSLLIIVVLQAALGVVGYEAIHLFEKYMAIVLAVMFAILTVVIIGKASTGLARTDALSGLDDLGAFITYVAIVASFVLAWALYASDYTRYLPPTAPRSRVFLWTVLGLSISAAWIEILGVMVADQSTASASGTINTILGGGLVGSLAMLAIVVGTVAVNAMNDYTGSLSLQAAGIHVKRVYSALVVAALGFLFTLYLNSGDFAEKFENYLLFIAYWIAPWAAVVLVDWWLRRGSTDVSGLSRFASLATGWWALASLIIGFAVSLPFQQSTLGFDFMNAGFPVNTIATNSLHGADLGFEVGFVVAAALYWIGARAGLVDTLKKA